MMGEVEVFDYKFIPPDLLHRDGPLDALQAELRGIPDPTNRNVIAIFGPSGSGKTTLARHVSDRSKRQFPDLRTAYVDCMNFGKGSSAFRESLRQANVLPPGSTENASWSRCLKGVRELDDPILIILDEFDCLNNYRILRPLGGTRGVWTIVISANGDDLMADLPSQHRNRLRSAPKIRLSKFTVRELRDILWGRIERGYHPALVTEQAVERAAELANGDALSAIGIMRKCVKEFEPTEEEQIKVGFVENVSDAAIQEVRNEFVENLRTHPRLLYTIIDNYGPISGSELRRRYESRAAAPRGDSQRINYLADLENDGLICSSGNTSATRYSIPES